MRAIALALSIAVASCSPAMAQQVCGEHSKIVEQLQGSFGETVLAIATNVDGSHLAEFFVNPETGSWTLVMTNGHGLACLAAAGENYQSTEALLGEES